MAKKNRARTKTSSFGVSGRFGHDSPEFYGKRIYSQVNLPKKNVEYIEKPIPEGYINSIFCKSSENMEELPDSCLYLMVTSPPYNVGKVYLPPKKLYHELRQI